MRHSVTSLHPHSQCQSDGTSQPTDTLHFRHTNTNYRIPSASYYDARNRPGASLYRARQPYLIKNAVTGVVIVAFVAGVCTSDH